MKKKHLIPASLLWICGCYSSILSDKLCAHLLLAISQNKVFFRSKDLFYVLSKFCEKNCNVWGVSVSDKES